MKFQSEFKMTLKVPTNYHPKWSVLQKACDWFNLEKLQITVRIFEYHESYDSWLEVDTIHFNNASNTIEFPKIYTVSQSPILRNFKIKLVGNLIFTPAPAWSISCKAWHDSICLQFFFIFFFDQNFTSRNKWKKKTRRRRRRIR